MKFDLVDLFIAGAIVWFCYLGGKLIKEMEGLDDE